jgi:integrase
VSGNGVGFDPLLDKRYHQTRLGRDVVDFLAWMELGGAASRTLDQYERDLSRGCLMFPGHSIEQLTDAELLHVARSFKAGERRVRVAAWRSSFKWARQTRRISESPMETLPTIKRPAQRVIDVFSDEEIATLCDLPVRDGALMQLLFDVGLRKGEARNLRLMHVRPEEIRILRGKGGKDRVVPATVNVSQKVNELAILEGTALGTISGTHAPAAARRSPARRRSATDHSTRGGVAASTRPTCATATRTSPGTRSRHAGFAAAGGLRRSRRRWAMPRWRRPMTSTDTWTPATWWPTWR